MASSLIRPQINMVIVDNDKWTKAMNAAKSASNNGYRTSKWLVVTSSNVCVANDLRWFKNFYPLTHHADLAAGSGLHILGGGDVILPLCGPGGDVINLELQNVAYAPDSRNNILSVSHLVKAKEGLSFGSDFKGMNIAKDGSIIGHAPIVDGLYELQLKK